MTDPSLLRQRIAAAIHRYDNHHALSGNDIPSKHHLGEADFVLAELRPELRSLGQAEAEAKLARAVGLYEQWVKAGPPPLGASMARWWDARLVELRGAIHTPTNNQPQEQP